MKDIILICEDLFGLEVLELISQINIKSIQKRKGSVYNVIGYLSDIEKPFGNHCCGIRRLGNVSSWMPSSNEHFVLGICKPKHKYEAVKSLKEKGACFESITTPWMLGHPLDLGEGSIISAYSIKRGIKIGKYVTVIGSMLSGHSIDDYSTILRFSNIAGDMVGKSTYIGNHVFLAVGKNIGDNCIVSDGSIVVNNVKSNTNVGGIPARKIK